MPGVPLGCTFLSCCGGAACDSCCACGSWDSGALQAGLIWDCHGQFYLVSTALVYLQSIVGTELGFIVSPKPLIPLSWQLCPLSSAAPCTQVRQLSCSSAPRQAGLVSLLPWGNKLALQISCFSSTQTALLLYGE